MCPENKFSEDKFLSITEKKKILRAWVRFLESGCKKNQFTEALYHHLSQHCSFIAHYDRHGFYDFYFERNGAEIFRFFDQFDPQKAGVSAEYGTTHWLSSHSTGADLNAAMRQAAGPYLRSLRLHFEETQRQEEIAQATRLLAKHGLAATKAITPTGVISADVDLPLERMTTVNPIQPQLFTE